ncbi:MAG: hypothetical protein ACTHKU_08635, partial [Verrucomicrobiota bacterium]
MHFVSESILVGKWFDYPTSNAHLVPLRCNRKRALSHRTMLFSREHGCGMNVVLQKNENAFHPMARAVLSRNWAFALI